jgi:hypothetical protein
MMSLAGLAMPHIRRVAYMSRRRIRYVPTDVYKKATVPSFSHENALYSLG